MKRPIHILRKENLTDNVLDACLVVSPADGDVGVLWVLATVRVKDGAAGDPRQSNTQLFWVQVLRDGTTTETNNAATPSIDGGTNTSSGTLTVVWAVAISGTTVEIRVTANTSLTIAGSDELDADFFIVNQGDLLEIAVAT